MEQPANIVTRVVSNKHNYSFANRQQLGMQSMVQENYLMVV